MLATHPQVTSELVSRHGKAYGRAREAWDTLAAKNDDASVFCHRPWVELGVETGAYPLWGVLVLRRGEEPIALVPLRKRSPWSWELAGALGPSEWPILVDPAWEDAVWPALAAWLAGTPGVGILEMGVTQREDRLHRLREACQARGLPLLATACDVPDVWTPLPESWAAFEARIGTHAAKSIRRAERLLREAYPEAALELQTTPEACAESVEMLMRWYRRRWGGVGLRCCFNHPEITAFYRRAIAWAAGRGHAAISLLRIGETPIAMETLFRASPRGPLYMHFCARDADALPNKYSPGIVEAAFAFRWAIDQGISRVNQGVLPMQYKSLFGGVDAARTHVVIARSPTHRTALTTLDRAFHLAHRLPVHLRYHLGRRGGES